MTKSPKKYNKTTIYLHFHTNTILRFIRVFVFYRRLERLEYMANKHIGVQSIIRELNSLAGAHSRSRSICELYGTEMQTSHHILERWPSPLPLPHESEQIHLFDGLATCALRLFRALSPRPAQWSCDRMETQTESFDPHNRRTTIHAATNSVKTVKYQRYI